MLQRKNKRKDSSLIKIKYILRAVQYLKFLEKAIIFHENNALRQN